MKRDPRDLVAAVAAAWFVMALAAGCSRPSGPPAIRTGTVCTSCGMEIDDLRFACERRAAGEWRAFDSIECLMRDSTAAEAEVLTDWETKALHDADSLWVVEGALAGPMGSCAAFMSRATADEIAGARGGRVARLSELRQRGVHS